MIASGGSSPPTPAPVFDRVIQWLLIALLAFMPFAFGAVDAWGEEVAIALVAAMALCLSVKLVVCRHTRFVWSWSYLPLVLFIGLVALQLTPLPDSWLSALSPHTLEMKRRLLLSFPNNPAARSKFTLSFYPYETRHHLRIVVAVAAVYVVALNAFRSLAQMKRLLIAIAIIATSVAFLDFLQILSGTTKIYWLIPMAHRYAGTFANHSHYGQFINLSVAAMIGVVMLFMSDARKSEPKSRRDDQPRRWSLNWPLVKVFLVVAAIILCMATLCLSLTRGGMVAAAVAGAWTGTIVWRTSSRSRPRAGLLLGIGVAFFVVLLASGFDGVFSRISSLENLRNAADFRPRLARDLFSAYRLFPFFGTGLGTHSIVFPVFQSFPLHQLAYHADDEYVQLAEEVGGVGLLLIASFLVIAFAAYTRALRYGRPSTRAAAAGLGFGLIAILIQSASDFGQRIPAIACLTAVVCAFLVNLASLPQSAKRASRKDAAANDEPQTSGIPARESTTSWGNIGLIGARLALPVRYCALLVLAALVPGALIKADAVRMAEAHWSVALAYESELRPKEWMGTNDEYARMIAAAVSANAYEPDNVRYAHWLNVYRWQAAARLQRLGADDPAARTLLKSTADHVINEMMAASALCPVFAPNYSVAGQLERLVLGHPEGLALANAGDTLWPYDANCAFGSVSVGAADERWDNAVTKLQRCVAADPNLYPAILNLLLVQHDHPELAVAVAGKDPELLFRLGKQPSLRRQHPEVAMTVQLRAAEIVRGHSDSADTAPGLLFDAGTTYADQRDLDPAGELLGLAVGREPGLVDWRLKYASVLSSLGRGDDAIQQARICLRLRPEMPEALDLIGNVYRHPHHTHADRTNLLGVQNAQTQ